MSFNQWYDQLKEPYRLIVLVLLVSPVGILATIQGIWAACAAWIWVVALLLLRLFGK